MPRTVPGSGAVIEPIFNRDFGVDSVVVKSGGKDYDASDPPQLTVTNCGTPESAALLFPIIESGKITHVRVLTPGSGYDPLRVIINANQDDSLVVDTFDIRSILTSVSASITTGAFAGDRLSLQSNNLPDPAGSGIFPSTFNNNNIFAHSFLHKIVYRGGKDVPQLPPNNDPAIKDRGSLTDLNQQNSSPTKGQIGLMSNGIPILTPDGGTNGTPPTGFAFDVNKTNFYDHDTYNGYPNSDHLYNYQDAKVIDSFGSGQGVFDIKTYYSETNFGGDKSRHANGHSKILGISYDGYPIYGPFGYTTGLDDQSAIKRIETSYRFRTGVEIDGNRIPSNTPTSTTYTVTVADSGNGNKFVLNGTEAPIELIGRGDTVTFNLDDASNVGHPLLITDFAGETNLQGWHASTQTLYDKDVLYERGVKYYINNSEVTYAAYLANYDAATNRKLEITVPWFAPNNLHYFCYFHANMGNKTNILYYPEGTFIEDYIYEAALGDLDTHNGRYCVTPEYPDGTYAYFLTTTSGGEPQYPYCIGDTFYSIPTKFGNDTPIVQQEVPSGARAEVILSETNTGQVEYVKMIAGGDGYFGDARVDILGGEGTGATATPVTKSISGLSLESSGSGYLSPPTLFFQGGGGQGAEGVADVDYSGIVTNINVVNPGRFYQDPPYIYIQGGGGVGAKATARIEQGEVVGIDVTDPGRGYTSAPNIIFTKLVNVKRKVRNRQSYNASSFFITGLQKSLDTNTEEVVVKSTGAFPGSGKFMIGREIIEYTSKDAKRFLGCTRGTNFRFDQRVIVDGIQNVDGVSTYEFNVGDRLVRRIESASNKVAVVYDWNPVNRELLIVFQVDELAFIDGGVPSTTIRTVAFDGGTPGASSSTELPHNIIDSIGDTIVVYQLTLTDKKFEDDAENSGAGDGIPDVFNTGTDFADQINLDGGIHNSLYGIEETVGGQNTTIFAIGDQVKDASIPFKYSTIESAGALRDGIEHTSRIRVILSTLDTNSISFVVGETVTGQNSNIQATVESWEQATRTLVLINPIPYFTNNVNLGIQGYFYEFSADSTVTQVRVLDPGLDYTATPTVSIENSGEIQAQAVVNMTSDGDQVGSLTVTNGGYGYTKQVTAGTLHPTVTFTNAGIDTTGSGAVAEVILGGEKLVGAGGASWRIESITYDTSIRDN